MARSYAGNMSASRLFDIGMFAVVFDSLSLIGFTHTHTHKFSWNLNIFHFFHYPKKSNVSNIHWARDRWSSRCACCTCRRWSRWGDSAWDETCSRLLWGPDNWSPGSAVACFYDEGRRVQSRLAKRHHNYINSDYYIFSDSTKIGLKPGDGVRPQTLNLDELAQFTWKLRLKYSLLKSLTNKKT